MELLKSDEIDRAYYNLKQVSEVVNNTLNLQGEDKIYSFNLAAWKKNGYIKYKLNGVKPKVTKEEVEHIIGFTFIHIFLGIKYSKINHTKNYIINDLSSHGIGENESALIKYLTKYNVENKEQQYPMYITKR